jgi:hypothetical protein
VSYARKIRDAWTFCLDSYQQQSNLAHALSGVGPEDFMYPGERRKYNKLPDEFLVYRGFQAGFRNGMSWSLDRNVAVMFSELVESLLARIDSRWPAKQK